MLLPANGFRTILGLAVLATACAWIAYSAITGRQISLFSAHRATGHVIHGSGHTTEESRVLSPFRSISLGSGIAATITIGDRPRLDIEADDNIVPLVRSRVEDGTLSIRLVGHVTLAAPPKVLVTVPELDRLTVESGKAVIAGLDGGTLHLVIEGAGDVAATGRLDAADIAIDGAGRLRFDGLDAHDLTLMVNGTGKADVRATGRLRIEINGAGDVTYAGPPAELEKRVHGAGTIRAAS